MKDCKLVRANLKQASFNNADLAGADLSGSDFSGADMRNAILVGAKTTMINLNEADLEGALTDKPCGVDIQSLPYGDMLAAHALWCETAGR